MVLNYETFRLTFSSYKMHGEHTCNAMIIIFSSAHMRNIVQCNVIAFYWLGVSEMYTAVRVGLAI